LSHSQGLFVAGVREVSGSFAGSFTREELEIDQPFDQYGKEDTGEKADPEGTHFAQAERLLFGSVAEVGVTVFAAGGAGDYRFATVGTANGFFGE
jgi:hypothetical protein